MPMPRYIVSTCGTSLLTNDASPELRRLVIQHANTKDADDLSKEQKTPLNDHINARTKSLEDASVEDLKRLSAELNGLLRFYADQPRVTTDHHVLVCTDTWLGEATARMVETILERFGHTVEVLRVPDLRTDELVEFRAAMSELVKWCAETVAGYRDAGHWVVFNLTGGFKSVQGFMQALAMIYADESVYVFESGQELLRLPRLPLELDAETVVRGHLPLFRRLAVGFPVLEAEAQDLPEPLLLFVDGTVALSVWGQLVWEEAKKAIYSEKILTPLSDKMRFGAGFLRTTERLDAKRTRILNYRLDQLARNLESDGQYNPRSLDFKQLAGTHDSSTHECDAWSDLDAKRLFGHYEDGIYVIDTLGEKLR